MFTAKALRENIKTPDFSLRLKRVYPKDAAVEEQTVRYAELLDFFGKNYGAERTIRLFSAPGRTEVGGNHTDHQHGRVLAAAVNLDAIAAASLNEEGIVRIHSKGYDQDVVEINDLTVHKDEIGKSAALVRGVLAALKNAGYKVGGFDAVTMSNVLSGSGLSSSAAFEVLVGTMVNYLFNDGKITPEEIAIASQYAENEYFGKPSGLMDQMASSYGNFITIDFEDIKNPKIEKLDFDFESSGYTLCVVDTGGNHSDLTDDYADVKNDMVKAAGVFGKSFLRDVSSDEFYANVQKVKEQAGTRAVLRAIHFFEDDARVSDEVAALNSGDFDAFKELVIASGRSSFMYNQNVFSTKFKDEQNMSVALALSEKILKGKGAWRVHGGGFAGTIQAFVPNELVCEYREKIEAVFGKDSCKELEIRKFGGVEI